MALYILPSVLEGLLIAEQSFSTNLRLHLPLPEGDTRKGAYQELMGLYDKYIPSDTARSIAMLLYSLKIYGTNRPDSLAKFIESHNAKISELQKDNEYSKRTGITMERLRAALFSVNQIKNASKNADYYGKHGTGCASAAKPCCGSQAG
nr:hypothetical protein [uncultured Rhodopila sp.]